MRVKSCDSGIVAEGAAIFGTKLHGLDQFGDVETHVVKPFMEDC